MAQDDNKKERKRRVYSTAVIDQLVKDSQDGYDIDFEPFFNRDFNLKAANVPFMMSPDEIEEYQKCYDDPIYFITKYCKFMNDKGFTTIELRDYQKKVIKTVTDEVYIPELDDYGPANRNVIYMAARQMGKCGSPCESIIYKCSNLTKSKENYFFEIEDKYNKERKTLLYHIKKFLYKIYRRL